MGHYTSPPNYVAEFGSLQQRLADLGIAVTVRPVWSALSLQNSWVSLAAPSEQAQFCKNAVGEVRLRGRIKGGASGSLAFTLPAGYRPGATGAYAMADSGATSGALVLSSSGEGLVYWSNNNTDCALSGITFLAEN